MAENPKINTELGDVQQNFVDKEYLLKFWSHIKNIAKKTADGGGIKYEVNLGNDIKYTKEIVQHIEDLYGLLNVAKNNSAKHTKVNGTENQIYVKPTTVSGVTTYTVSIDEAIYDRLIAIANDQSQRVTKSSVKINKNATDTDATVNAFESSGSITVGGENGNVTLEVSLPSNPTTGMTGGSSTANGITLSNDGKTSGKKIGEPVLAVQPGEIGEDVDKITTGGKVYEYIKTNLTDASQHLDQSVAFGKGTLLPGTLTVKMTVPSKDSEGNITGAGTANVVLEPVLTETYGETELTNGAIATDAYVIEKTNGIGNTYEFKEDGVTTGTTGVVLEKSGDTAIYQGKLTLSGKNKAGETLPDKEVVIKIDTTEFVKDAFLTSANVVTPTASEVAAAGYQDADATARVGKKCLALTVKLADGSDKIIYVPLEQFIDLYQEGNGIGISSDLKVSAKTSGYVKIDETAGDANKGIILDGEQIQNESSTTGFTDEEIASKDQLATKGYVDQVNNSSSVSVDVVGGITGFNQTASISITDGATADATTKKLEIKVPELKTNDTLDNNNVVTSINNTTGAISVATNEKSADATGTNTKLAQKGYVDEKVSTITYKEGYGIDINNGQTDADKKNEISLEPAANGYLKFDGDGNLIINSESISDANPNDDDDHDLLATEKYVLNKLNANGIKIGTADATIDLTPDDNSVSKTYNIDMPIATWAAADFVY